jgi:hypothetical protein
LDRSPAPPPGTDRGAITVGKALLAAIGATVGAAAVTALAVDINLAVLDYLSRS